MIVDARGKYGKDLLLATTMNSGNLSQHMFWLANQWAPKKAKSFTICLVGYNDCTGKPQDHNSNFATFWVRYFSTKKEGLSLIS